MSSFSFNADDPYNLDGLYTNYNNAPNDFATILEFDEYIDMLIGDQSPVLVADVDTPGHVSLLNSSSLPQAGSYAWEITAPVLSNSVPGEPLTLVSHESGLFYNDYTHKGALSIGTWATGNGWPAQASDDNEIEAAIASDIANISRVDATPTCPRFSPPVPPRKSRRKSKPMGGKPYKCSQCPQTSNREHNMKEHKLIHDPNRSRQVVCHIPHCKRPFARNSDRTRHFRTTPPASVIPPSDTTLTEIGSSMDVMLLDLQRLSFLNSRL